MTPKKVLFIIPYLTEGGAQRALSGLECHLPDDWKMDTLVNSEIGMKFPIKGKLISLNIDIKPKTSSVFFQLIAFIKRVKTLRNLKKSNTYDACISFIDSANVANLLTSKYSGKTIISIRTSLKSKKTQLNYKCIVIPLAKLLYNKADSVVVVSEELKEETRKLLRIQENKLETITNGFDLINIREESYKPIRSDIINRIGDRKVVFSAGRLCNAKHQWHLIRSMKEVLRNEENVVLVIAGTGDLREYLEKLVTDIGLDNNVIFLGFENNVYKYMKYSSLFVLPSGHEGFPNALAEALCVGTPCVATDFRTGARELLAPKLLGTNAPIEDVTECEYGILSPVCSGTMYKGEEPLETSEEMLAKAILTMLNPAIAKKYREKCHIRSRSLGIDDTVKKWIRIIEN